GSLVLPAVHAQRVLPARFAQFLSLTRMHTRSIMRGVLFIVTLLLGLALLTTVLLMSGKIYGTAVYPVTHLMVDDIKGALSLFLLIVLAFYAGELVWRDRPLGAHQMLDTTPVPTWVPLLAKVATLVLVVLAFLAVGAVYTIGFQLVSGYTHLQPGVYLSGLALAAANFVLIGILALALQVVANNKF